MVVIPIKYYRFVFSFMMATCMSFVISGALTYINLGLVDDFIGIWLLGWGKSFVVAYPTLLMLFPVVSKVAKAICKD